MVRMVAVHGVKKRVDFRRRKAREVGSHIGDDDVGRLNTLLPSCLFCRGEGWWIGSAPFRGLFLHFFLGSSRLRSSKVAKKNAFILVRVGWVGVANAAILA
jgi:hypothetical protein